MTLYAASTPRTIGLVLAIIVAVGFAIYVLFNIRAGRKEIGAEVELAPNRKPYYDDETLETKRLDISAVTKGKGLQAKPTQSLAAIHELHPTSS